MEGIDMAKHLMLIHGRHFKPNKTDLRANWLGAIRHGLKRDGHEDALAVYRGMKPTFVYYGNISNKFLKKYDDSYDKAADVADRKECLRILKGYSRADFLRDEGENKYKNLPGHSSLTESLADALAGFADLLGIAGPMVRAYAPDLAHYWNPDAAFGSDVRWSLTEPLGKALCENHDVMLVSHSLGSMIAYDVLWKFSYYGEYKELREKNNKLTKLVTLGSPLGNETVKRNLKGANADGPRRYPALIRAWENFAAEDDYISHDETLKDDYRKMENYEMVEQIRDHRIYNLAVRNGESNPHHGAGYLIHPEFITVLAEWLTD